MQSRFVSPRGSRRLSIASVAAAAPYGRGAPYDRYEGDITATLTLPPLVSVGAGSAPEGGAAELVVRAGGDLLSRS